MGSATFDVVVVGAGTAGANAAYQLARRGRRVMLVERRAADAGGAQWFNGLLDRHFQRAGLDVPSGAERHSAGNTVHLRATDPRVGPTLRDAPTVATDMALLGRRLRGLAVGAGVELVDEVREMGVEADAATGRLRSVVLERAGRSRPVKATAALFVDASGRQGILRRHSADLEPWCPTLTGDELCSAADSHHEVSDTVGAEAFLERYGARPGDSVTLVGTNGGFATCAVTVSQDLATVGVLVGSLANGRYAKAPRMVSELLRQERWIGAATRSGAGVIPLRRPYARTTAPGLALVGDAACHVFPAHGSGVGVGLVAGTVLAEGVADAGDPGDPAVLWTGYQAPFQRELGGVLAAYDALRRLTTALGSRGVDGLVRSGLVDEHTTRTGLEQRWAPPPPSRSLRTVGAFAGHPRLAGAMVPALVRAQLLHAHAGRYPQRPDLGALARWDRRAQRLLGPLPS